MASLSKKGVVEVQFGWIFVIVVGALILLFFLSVVKTTTKSSSEAKFLELKAHLSSMISQSEVDVGTTRTIGMPAIVLDFDCGGYNIEGSSSKPESFPYKTFFSPNIIKGREIITYSKYWEMPYTVDYFIYITSKEVRYNFINGTACTSQCELLLSAIIKELPANITYQVVASANNVKENNYYKERFIFINSEPTAVHTSLSSMKNEDVTAIKINGTENYGKIQYYQKNSSGAFIKTVNSSYLGFPMLIGAIISEAPLYECNVNKSLNKFKIITKLYQNRTVYLRDYYDNFISGNEYKCYLFYNRIELQGTLVYLSFPNPFSKFYDIQQNAMSLEDDNEELMIFSCPMIY